MHISKSESTLKAAVHLNVAVLYISQILQEMLDLIERQQRNKLKLDNMSMNSPERHRPLRHQYSSDNMHVPAFNIPNLRIDQRKTSSAEDMARKNSTGIKGGSIHLSGIGHFDLSPRLFCFLFIEC